MKPAVGYGNDYFTAHDAAFQAGIRIYFTCIVAVGRNRLMGSEFFKPYIKIMMQARLVIIDEYTGSNMHGVYQAQAFLYVRFTQQGFRFTGYSDKFSMLFRVKP